MLIGTTLGHFRITGTLGSGGMGEVYLALDTRLGRDVALKVLPGHLTADREDLARFEREARVLASLSHPHIAAIHEVGEATPEPPDAPAAATSGGACRFLVMERIAGENLAQRLERGPVPPDDALAVVIQVAAALEAAHERGIVHRDIKPANVMVGETGHVKVLDFGIAKLVSEGRGADAAPTVTAQPTGAGVVIGTAAYLSPEQARGDRVDARTDVWGVGCILYELLTGQRAFPGRTANDCIAAVLGHDPDWTALPAATPPLVRWAIERCLRREPHQRLHAAADVRLALEAAAAGDETGTGPAGAADAAGVQQGRHHVAAWATAALIVTTGLLVGLWAVPWRTPEAPRPQPVTFPLQLGTTPVGGVLENTIAIAPDGASFVYQFADDEGARLRMKRLADAGPVDLPGTEGAINPFFSPDGRHLGFTVGGEIHRMELPSGPSRVIFSEPGALLNTPTWGTDDTILFGRTPPDVGIFSVPAAGGTPTRATRPDEAAAATAHVWPQWLPDGARFLFVGIGSAGGTPQLFVGSIDDDAVRPVEGVHSRAVYIETGHLVYLQGQSLVARPFDLEAEAWTGEPVLLVDSVRRFAGTGKAVFAASPTLLVSIDSPYVAQLTWFNREGEAVGVIGEPGDLWGPRFSPAGDHVVVAIADPETSKEDLWIYEVSSGVGTRLTFTPDVEEGRPVWSPDDGRQVAFYSDALGIPTLTVRATDGSSDETVLLEAEVPHLPTDWSPDGQSLLYSRGTPPVDIWVASPNGGSPRPVIEGPGDQVDGRFSPDGRWIAFQSNELGRWEIFIAPMADGTARRRVSPAGGERPFWSRDGHELLYTAGRALMSVPIDAGSSSPVIGTPRELFQLHPPHSIGSLDVTPDGERFLIAVLDSDKMQQVVTARLNWAASLESRRAR